GDKVRMLRGDATGDDFRESAELLVGIDGLDGNEDVETGGAGSFQKTLELQSLKFVVKRLGNGNDDGEFGAIGRIEIEEEIIGMGKIADAARPGIVIDAAEAS